MSTADRPSRDGDDASAVAATIRDAGFVNLVARADGDALAAVGLLAAACDAAGTPYKASVARTRAALDARCEEGGTPVVVGASTPDAVCIDADPASPAAVEAARDLGDSPDAVLALAGVVAAGSVPGETGSGLLARADLARRPGVATPTPDPADGLAHTTLAHAPFSGDPDASGEVVEELDVGDGPNGADRRRLASRLAIDAVGDDGASERAATAIEAALRPHVGGPFETLGGYADVLCALAREAPGLGVALALGTDASEATLDAWREHARAAHAAVREAHTGRYDGLLAARAEGPVETAARLLRDFRSPEPAVLVVAEGEAGLAATEPLGDAIEAAAESLGGSGLARGRRGYARFDAGAEEFVAAVREAL